MHLLTLADQALGLAAPLSSAGLEIHLWLTSAAGFFWDNPIFKKETWNGATNFVRLGLTFVGAMLLIYAHRARKLGQPVSERTQRRVAILFTVLAFGVYYDYFNPNVRYNQYYHRHEFFHYYLGSKYFDEVGYSRIYECAAIAETELGRRAAVARRDIRDLRVNLIKPMKDTYVLDRPEECKKNFTPERWEAWKKDVDWFQKSAAGTYWENMMKDHGYNPPPVWTMAGKFFSSFGAAGDGFFKALASIDIMLQLGAVLMIGWAFGWKVMAIAAVFWGCNAPANFYWTGGAFMRQDWIFLLVASVCFARKKRYVLSGAALTWSALLRVFPMILFAGVGIVIAIHVFREIQRRRSEHQALAAKAGGPRPPPPRSRNGLLALLHPTHRQFISGCIIAGAVLIPSSMAVAGPDSYVDFYHHIGVHKNTPLTNHMGLDTILAHHWDGRMRFMRDDNLDDPFEGWKQNRLDRLEMLKPLRYAIILAIGLWTVWALRRTKKLWLALPLGLPLVMCLTNLTCYYYSMFMIAAVLYLARPSLGPVLLALSGASQVVYINYYWVDDKFTAIAYLFFLLSVLLLAGMSRPFSMDRLKAWLSDRPELEPKASLAPANRERSKEAA